MKIHHSVSLYITVLASSLPAQSILKTIQVAMIITGYGPIMVIYISSGTKTMMAVGILRIHYGSRAEVPIFMKMSYLLMATSTELASELSIRAERFK